MPFDIEAHVNCASFTPSISPVCAGCPQTEACYGEFAVAINVVRKPVQLRPAPRPRGVLTLRHTRSITLIVHKE